MRASSTIIHDYGIDYFNHSIFHWKVGFKKKLHSHTTLKQTSFFLHRTTQHFSPETLHRLKQTRVETVSSDLKHKHSVIHEIRGNLRESKMNPKIKIIQSKCKVTRNRSRRKLNFCTDCALQFGNQTIFKLHIKLVHSKKMRKITKLEYDPIIFPCTHCKERFTSITTYELHFRYVHSDILVKQQMHRLECQQNIVTDLKSQIQRLKEKNAETERHLTYLNENQARQVRNFENKIERLENFSICKICLNHEIDTVYLPCCHCIACHVCSEHETIRSCPTCREDIDSKLRIKF